jgi:hypothetical protein
MAELIANNFSVPVFKGPAGVNAYNALTKVSVLPNRFLRLFPDYEFIQLSDGLKDVCNVAKTILDMPANISETR